MAFPVKYGLFPRTWYDDNDLLDIVLLSYELLEVGCILWVRFVARASSSKLLAQSFMFSL